MRPRITKQEAAYIVEVLKANLEKITEKKQELRKLRGEVALLSMQIQSGNWIPKTVFERRDKRLLLEQKEKACFNLSIHIDAHEKLLKKYEAIAEGTTHRGTYKHFSTVNDFAVSYASELKLTRMLQT